MPSRLSSIPGRKSRKTKLTLLLLICPLFFYGQSLTGLWTGALSNDSNTVRKDQLFEIALTEYRGKVYGYSRSEFIVNDTLYYIVKRVKGTITGDICEVTDDDIVAYNFRGKLDKGIKVTSTFKRNGSDSAWYLAGTWKTNATKKYYSVTGKVDLGQEKDLSASKIFPHLEELKLADEVAFYKERNDAPVVARIAKPQRVKTEYSFNNDPAPAMNVAAPDLIRAEADPVLPDLKKAGDPLARTGTKPINSGSTSVVVVAPQVERSDAEPLLTDLKKADNAPDRTRTGIIPATNSNIAVTAPDLQRTDPDPVLPGLKKTGEPLTNIGTKEIKTGGTVAKPVAASQSTVAPRNTTPPPASIAKNTTPDNSLASRNTRQTVNPPSTATGKPPAPAGQAEQSSIADKLARPQPVNEGQKTTALNPVISAPRKSIEELTKNVTSIAGRKSEFSQVVDFKSDSLVLSLYDNGEIDGDTVSVIMNGEMIMARQGLKASAIRKTIYIQPGQNEDFTLVLFADNLGKYPPNTGLLVVHDGEDVYHLRFSSDFQKSSGIVFRRKTN